MIREVELEAEARRLKESNRRLISEIDHRDTVINSLSNHMNSLSLILMKLQQEREKFFLLGREKRKLGKDFDVLQRLMMNKDEAITNLIEHNKVIKQRTVPLMQQNKELAGHNADLMENILDLKRDLEEKERILNERSNYFNMLVERNRSDTESKIRSILENDMRAIVDLKKELDRIKSRD